MENESGSELASVKAAVEQSLCVTVTGVSLRIVGGSLVVKKDLGKDLDVVCEAQNKVCCVQYYRGSDVVYKVDILSSNDIYKADTNVLLFRANEGSAMTVFAGNNDTVHMLDYIHKCLSKKETEVSTSSVFNRRTEEASAKQYFQFYGYLSQQQNMMQDYIRTSTYQTAILHNLVDFKDKVVLDVGAGTGVLSFFALQGGARKVYSVEASNMSAHCSKLVTANKFSTRMTVIAGKIEEIDLPEEVDVILSEPMGYMLFNERMLETYLHAKKWLKPGGKMYPTQGLLYVAPFSDEALYLEQMGKTYFWQQHSFHGVDVSVLHSEAVTEYFRQPIVDTFDIRILMSRPIAHTTDFATAQEEELYTIDIPLRFKSWSTGYMHGLAFWFDVAFIGGQTTVWLSTAPFQPLTHWYQVRLLLKQPLYVQEGHEITGLVKMVANERQSYDIMTTLMVVETNLQSSGTYDLKNPHFRYMSTPQAPPGSLHTNPTETYFDSQTTTTAVAGVTIVSGATQQPQQGGGGGGGQTQHTPLLSAPPHPQLMRSSGMQSGGYVSHNQYSMGVLQTGTEVIPVVNGSIITPSVQQQTGGLQLASDMTHTSYMQYGSRQQTQGQWGTGLHSMHTAPHFASYQHGMEFGMGSGQHGMGALQYGMGTLGQPFHTNQQHGIDSLPSGGSRMYQPKWSSQQPTIISQVVASNS